MATLLTERAVDFGSFRQIKLAGRALPFTPQELAHIYIKLEIKDQFENAKTADDAKKFHRSVARASMAAHAVAERYGGVLLEVQGSLLHVGLPRGGGITERTEMDSANAFIAELHGIYRIVFDNAHSRVEAWRLTVDMGKTLVVAGRGVHGDDSWVSLGRAANDPAKHLYAQLEKSEAERDLKRFYVAVKNPANGRWHHENLDRIPRRLEEAVKAIAEDLRRVEPKLTFFDTAIGWKQVTARSLPLGPSGTPASPTPDTPHISFGWAMRTDLDGFTARVQDCLDKDYELQKLAEEFYSIMDAAAAFTEQHKETLAQLPWAGDNFTAAAVFDTKVAYDDAIPKRLVELSLDFEKDMAEAATDCGFGGWAHGVAGGEVHGNAAGNVYLAGIEIGQRRFLVGAGEGFGRSAKAFGDIDPKAGDIVIYRPDWERLDQSYKKAFEPAVNVRGQTSTVYYIAKAEALVRIRARAASVSTTTPVTFGIGQSRPVPTRPHFQ